VFRKRLLKKTFGAKKGERTGEGKKLHNKKLHDL
jgi:hypothetical protein